METEPQFLRLQENLRSPWQATRNCKLNKMKAVAVSGHCEWPYIADATADRDLCVKSAVRAVRISELFAQIQRETRVNKLINCFGSPQSSTSLLLRSLVRLGYIKYLPRTRCHIPTTRVALLGSWIRESPSRDDNISGLRGEVNAESGGAITFAFKRGIYVKFVQVVHATAIVRMHIPVGIQQFLVWSPIEVPLLGAIPDVPREIGIAGASDLINRQQTKWVRMLHSAIARRCPRRKCDTEPMAYKLRPIGLRSRCGRLPPVRQYRRVR